MRVSGCKKNEKHRNRLLECSGVTLNNENNFFDDVVYFKLGSWLEMCLCGTMRLRKISRKVHQNGDGEDSMSHALTLLSGATHRMGHFLSPKAIERQQSRWERRSNRFLINMAPEAHEFRSDCKKSSKTGLSILDRIQFIENIAIDNVNKRNFTKKQSSWLISRKNRSGIAFPKITARLYLHDGELSILMNWQRSYLACFTISFAEVATYLYFWVNRNWRRRLQAAGWLV